MAATITRVMSWCQASTSAVLTRSSPGVIPSPSSSKVFSKDFVPLKSSGQFTATGRSSMAKPMPNFRSIAGASASPQVSSDVADKSVDLKKLDGINVYTPEGAEVPLLSLWEKRPAVVAFTRHFGCMLCKKRMATLESRKAEMDAAGVALITITPGNPEQARKYLADHKFSGGKSQKPNGASKRKKDIERQCLATISMTALSYGFSETEVYVDPKQESHGALEFTKGLGSTLNSMSMSLSKKATDEGYKVDWSLFFGYGETMRRGAWQQGGILVAGPGSESVKFIHKDAYSGDEPQMEEVMSACCA